MILSEQTLFMLQSVKIGTDFQHKSLFFEYSSFIDVQNTDESHQCC